MTIKLARIVERDGLVFLVDKDGKELGQVVPKTLTQAQRMSLEHGQTESEIYKAMLSAATVDVSAALVKVPERRNDDPKDYSTGWNACLDELEQK